jgi:hypothetical protein
MLTIETMRLDVERLSAATPPRAIDRRRHLRAIG